MGRPCGCKHATQSASAATVQAAAAVRSTAVVATTNLTIHRFPAASFSRTSSTRGSGCMTTASFLTSFISSPLMMYLPAEHNRGRAAQQEHGK